MELVRCGVMFGWLMCWYVYRCDDLRMLAKLVLSDLESRAGRAMIWTKRARVLNKNCEARP